MKKEEIDVPQLTKISSKGQIVVPTSLRKKLNIKEGTYFAVSAKKGMLVLKKLDTKMNAEDIRTLKLLEEAWDDIAKGRYRVATVDDFFKEMAKWKK